MWLPLTLFMVLFTTATSTAMAGIDTLDGSGFVIIRKISLQGNKRTKPSIILREMKFAEGDTLAAGVLPALLRESQQNIFNTRLFNVVTLDSTSLGPGGETTVTVNMIERWYIWPIPYIEFSDRNFNVWWENKDLSHITYGVDLTFNNMRGRNETLIVMAHLGYEQLYGFTYRIPYINRKETFGTGFGAGVELNHEVAVETRENRQVFLKDPSRYLRNLSFAYAELFYRPSFYTLHTLRFSYNQLLFSDTVIKTPGFSLDEMNLQRLFYLSYQYKLDHRDVQYYPLKGYYFDASLVLGFPYTVSHDFHIKTNLRRYWQLFGRWYWATGFAGKATFASVQPYYLTRALGYDRDYVRGYEYYVVDGQHFALLKNNLKFALLPQRIIRLGFIPSQKFNTIPVAIYLNAFCDLGYVYNHRATDAVYRETFGNTLENSLLVGWGGGIDLATYYDFVVRMEVSVNGMGKPGFFLHFMASI